MHLVLTLAVYVIFYGSAYLTADVIYLLFLSDD